MTKEGMHLRAIRTEADHESAFSRIRELIGAGPGTAEGEELDVLATLVCAYEARHYPIHPLTVPE